EAREHVQDPESTGDRDSGVARAVGRMADRVQRAPERSAMEDESPRAADEEEHGQLDRHDAAEVRLAEPEESRRQAGDVVDAAGEPAVERERTERHDERRKSEARDEERRQTSARRADRERRERRDADREPGV